MPAWLVQFIIAVALNVVAYVITPKPKTKLDKASIQEIQYPTASAGKPMVVIFGTCLVTSPNVLWYGEPGTKAYQVNV